MHLLHVGFDFPTMVVNRQAAVVNDNYFCVCHNPHYNKQPDYNKPSLQVRETTNILISGHNTTKSSLTFVSKRLVIGTPKICRILFHMRWRSIRDRYYKIPSERLVDEPAAAVTRARTKVDAGTDLG